VGVCHCSVCWKKTSLSNKKGEDSSRTLGNSDSETGDYDADQESGPGDETPPPPPILDLRDLRRITFDTFSDTQLPEFNDLHESFEVKTLLMTHDTVHPFFAPKDSRVRDGPFRGKMSMRKVKAITQELTQYFHLGQIVTKSFALYVESAARGTSYHHTIEELMLRKKFGFQRSHFDCESVGILFKFFDLNRKIFYNNTAQSHIMNKFFMMRREYFNNTTMYNLNDMLFNYHPVDSKIYRLIYGEQMALFKEFQMALPEHCLHGKADGVIIAELMNLFYNMYDIDINHKLNVDIVWYIYSKADWSLWFFNNFFLQNNSPDQREMWKNLYLFIVAKFGMDDFSIVFFYKLIFRNLIPRFLFRVFRGEEEFVKDDVGKVGKNYLNCKAAYEKNHNIESRILKGHLHWC
jgi:hypothetical protein